MSNMDKWINYVLTQLALVAAFSLLYWASTADTPAPWDHYLWYSLTIQSTVGYRPSAINFQDTSEACHYLTMVQMLGTMLVTAYFV